MSEQNATAEQWAEVLGILQKLIRIETMDGDRGGDYQAVVVGGVETCSPSSAPRLQEAIRNVMLPLVVARDAAFAEGVEKGRAEALLRYAEIADIIAAVKAGEGTEAYGDRVQAMARAYTAGLLKGNQPKAAAVNWEGLAAFLGVPVEDVPGLPLRPRGRRQEPSAREDAPPEAHSPEADTSVDGLARSPDRSGH